MLILTLNKENFAFYGFHSDKKYFFFRDLNKTSSEDNWMALKEKLLRESNYVLQQHNLKNKSLLFFC